jgi:hypothetical protein
VDPVRPVSCLSTSAAGDHRTGFVKPDYALTGFESTGSFPAQISAGKVVMAKVHSQLPICPITAIFRTRTAVLHPREVSPPTVFLVLPEAEIVSKTCSCRDS